MSRRIRAGTGPHLSVLSQSVELFGGGSDSRHLAFQLNLQT